MAVWQDSSIHGQCRGQVDKIPTAENDRYFVNISIYINKICHKLLQNPDRRRGPEIYYSEHPYLVAAAFGMQHPEEAHIALRFDADPGWVDWANSAFGPVVHWALAPVFQVLK